MGIGFIACGDTICYCARDYFALDNSSSGRFFSQTWRCPWISKDMTAKNLRLYLSTIDIFCSFFRIKPSMIRNISKEEKGMKNQKYQNGHGPVKEDKEFFQPEGNVDEVIGSKVLYNWLYQQEEEEYYLGEKISNSLSDIPQEALFVEY